MDITPTDMGTSRALTPRSAMSDWEWLVGDAVIGAILPEAYARYRRPIVEGLGLFLSRLPARDVAQIMADQAALPAQCHGGRTPGHAGRALPGASQAGPGPGAGSTAGARVAAAPPATRVAAADNLDEDDRGNADPRTGSAGATGHRASAPGTGRGQCRRRRAIPVHAPDPEQRRNRESSRSSNRSIEERLARELGLLQEVGGLLDERCAAFAIPPLDYREVFDQVREKLGTEVDLSGEQRHLEQAAVTYADEPEVLIPRLLPFCSSRVTAMERRARATR